LTAVSRRKEKRMTPSSSTLLTRHTRLLPAAGRKEKRKGGERKGTFSFLVSFTLTSKNAVTLDASIVRSYRGKKKREKEKEGNKHSERAVCSSFCVAHGVVVKKKRGREGETPVLFHRSTHLNLQRGSATFPGIPDYQRGEREKKKRERERSYRSDRRSPASHHPKQRLPIRRYAHSAGTGGGGKGGGKKRTEE